MQLCRVGDLGVFGHDGNGVAAVLARVVDSFSRAADKAPHQIFFIPTTEVKSVPRASSSTVDFRHDLAKIPSGTKIYEIVATESATAPFVRVGQVVTRSEVVASKYGDEKLFFKHEEATKAP